MKAVRAVGLLMIAALAFARDCVSGPLSAAEVAPAWKPREAGKTVRNLAAARPSAEDGVRWKNALNLLPLIDTASRDVRAGRWKGEHGALVSDDHWGARIEIPYKPPDEYDCRIAFTKLQPTERTEGRIDGIDLYLPRCGRTVAWAVGGWQNSVSGLERVAGTNPGQPENPTEIKHSAFLKVGQKHIVIVEVRKDSIMGYLDGELITQWKGNWKDLNFPAWVSQTLLGFASYSPTVFHCIEVVEVTGKGTFFERGDRRLAITSPVLEETRWKNAVSLLPRIDPPKHARGGKWEIKGGELLSDETWGAHLKLPYQPPEEYDCRICFTKTKPEGKLDGLNVKSLPPLGLS